MSNPNLRNPYSTNEHYSQSLEMQFEHIEVLRNKRQDKAKVDTISQLSYDPVIAKTPQLLKCHS